MKDLNNLLFLKMFLLNTGLTQKDFAERNGVHKKTVQHYFQTDDISLSTAQRLLAGFGCKMELRYIMPSSSVHIHPDVIARVQASAGKASDRRLAFLDEALASTGLNSNTLSAALLAKGVEIKPYTISRNLRIDDAKMSQLYSYATAFDSTLEITICLDE